MTDTQDAPAFAAMAERFRGYLPVVVDVETGGFDWNKHALLEIAAIPIELDAAGNYVPGEVAHAHIAPAPGTSIDPKSLEVTGIKIGHPLRGEVDERTGLDAIFVPVRAAVKKHGCQRAILVGHNAHFDLNFLNAAVARVQHKRNPFHPFSVFDTVTMAGMAYGQTVLARAATDFCSPRPGHRVLGADGHDGRQPFAWLYGQSGGLQYQSRQDRYGDREKGR